MFAYLLTLLIDLSFFTLPKAGEGGQFALGPVYKVYGKKGGRWPNPFDPLPWRKGLSRSQENAYHFITFYYLGENSNFFKFFLTRVGEFMALGMGMLNQEMNDILGKYRFRHDGDGMSVKTLPFYRKALLGFVLGLWLFGSPMGGLSRRSTPRTPQALSYDHSTLIPRMAI